jgi:predicted nucleic acid-binding protein
MIVVSDTTPLNYLIIIQRVEILRSLYHEVVIPQAVVYEMQATGTPEPVIEWIKNRPAWIIVKQSRLSTRVVEADIEEGEAEAILLAEQLGADLILLDDRRAREVAQNRGLKVVGTLGILIDAAQRNLIDLDLAIADLKESNFRISQQLLDSARKQVCDFET